MPVSFREALLSKNFVYVLILLLGSMSLGIAIAYPSPTLTDISFYFLFSRGETSMFNAITSLTAVLGPFFTNLFINTRGRRYSIKAVAILCCISWVFFISLKGTRKYLAIFSRAILGIAAGGFSAVIPVYIMELSPSNCRSIYGSMHQFGITIGIFLINLLGIYYTFFPLAWISFGISLLLFIGMWIVPESPTFANRSSVSQPDEASLNSSPNESITSGRHQQSLIIGIMMMIFQQFSGINAVLSNLGTIIASRNGPALAASAQCFSVLICISVIERIGRRKTWMISLFGSSLSLFILGLDYKFYFQFLRVVEDDGTETSTISVLAAFSFLFFFCFGLGPIPWFLPPEMFPDRLRALALSILSSLNWIFSFAVIYIYPRFVFWFGLPITFYVFGTILALGGFYGMGILTDNSRPKRNDEVPSFADVMVNI